MSGLVTKATPAAVHALIIAAGKEGRYKTGLAGQMQVGRRAIMLALQPLCDAGKVVAELRDRTTFYIDRAVYERGEIPPTPAFKCDVWTRPLQYDIYAHRNLAMASRSA